MKRSVLIVLLAAVVAGCATSPPMSSVAPQTKFVGAEHDRYRQSGAGTITGQGFLRQKGGGIVTCAGSPVLLIPATPFFREVIGILRSGRQIGVTEKIDPAYISIIKQSLCDAQGNFSFLNIPAGTWLVMTEVKWTVGYAQQGGALLREVTIADGESIRVLLSDNDFIGR